MTDTFEFRTRRIRVPGFIDIMVFVNDTRRGTITLTVLEWNILSAILKDGNFYQDGEVNILVQDAVHAFLKGAPNGEEISGESLSPTN